MLAEGITGNEIIETASATRRLWGCSLFPSQAGPHFFRLSPPLDDDDGDGRPGRSTMSPMWSGKSASVEAAMKNMLAAATQDILDQWEICDDEDDERKHRSQQELDE